MTDLYVSNPSKLMGQPKLSIGNYVSQNKILVPNRGFLLDSTRSLNIPIICRSEHIQEYAGVSGLLPSPNLSDFPEIGNLEELTEEIIKIDRKLASNCGNQTNLEIYCGILGIDSDTIIKQSSYSLWEKIEGINHVVVADSSVKELYHIFTSQGKLRNYSKIYQGNIISEAHGKNVSLPKLVRKNVLKAIEVYEEVRNLDNFDSQHCPIMEFVSTKENVYFLQYHPARDFKEAKFQLVRSKEKDEVEAVAVFGSSTEDGCIVPVTIFYGQDNPQTRYSKWLLPQNELGSFDWHTNFIFSELMVRRRKVQLIETCKNEINFWNRIAQSQEHYSLSKIFKPEISLFFDTDMILTLDEKKKLYSESIRTKKDQTITLKVTSDGRRAFIKRLF